MGINHIASGLYVAADGSWGDAAAMSIIDDRDWTSKDYSILDESSDGRRADLADAIHYWIKDGRPEFENFNSETDFMSDFLLEKYIEKTI